MEQNKNARMSDAGDKEVHIQNGLKWRFRLLVAVDFVQEICLGFLTIRIVLIQRTVTGTVQSLTQLTDLVRQLLDGSAQLINLARRLLVALA